ncbi:hypothetical protein [Microcoleus vaginatus]|uniref:hypothetical protein n=1 Tax=Microcoleus vaginatus TaxID=119532 RepID=UPI0032A4A173
MPPFLISTLTNCLSVMTEFCPLREKEPEFTNPVSPGWFMLWWNSFMAIDLVEFDKARAIASLKSGELVIPVWCARIDQLSAGRLRG